MTAAPDHRGDAVLITTLLVCCTVLGLAGTDLVLPAVPELPAALGGSVSASQLVLATFAAGTGVGLLLFGELGARIAHGNLLVAALGAYAATSAAAALSGSLELLIALRFLQGVAASCAAVVTPGMVRALFDEQGALRALGFLGSVESLAPAIAPIIGVWLLSQLGWQGSFWVTAVLAVILCLILLLVRRRLPRVQGRRVRYAYLALLRNAAFQREALSQGCALASLLVFVFAMPTVFVVALGGELRDFITMQLIGISSFIVAANLSSRAVARFGARRVIRRGTQLALFGAASLFGYALAGGETPAVIWLLFVPLNAGFGLRGPPAFYHALEASSGDDGRASALIILYTMLLTAAGTALLAPVIERGLVAPTLAAALLGMLSLWLLKPVE